PPSGHRAPVTEAMIRRKNEKNINRITHPPGSRRFRLCRGERGDPGVRGSLLVRGVERPSGGEWGGPRDRSELATRSRSGQQQLPGGKNHLVYGTEEPTVSRCGLVEQQRRKNARPDDYGPGSNLYGRGAGLFGAEGSRVSVCMDLGICPHRRRPVSI